jgi:hypothetical protein
MQDALLRRVRVEVQTVTQRFDNPKGTVPIALTISGGSGTLRSI